MGQHNGWTRSQLKQHQASALQRLRDFAYAHSPFYQRFHRGVTHGALQELPVLSKALLMEHFDEIVTDRAVRLRDAEAYLFERQTGRNFLQHYRLLSTSGSTGRRGFFLFNSDEWLTVLASYARATRDWTGLSHHGWQRIRAAGVSSALPWHISAQVNTDLRNWWIPTLVMDAGEKAETMAERLHTWQPALLMGYPSALYMLAQEQLAGRLQIAPHTIITSSEVLTDGMRRSIQTAWGGRVFNLYGSTEGACLAMECEQHRGMHLYEDLVIIEVVDNENRPVPPGIYGDKLLITVLFSRTLPLIRYEVSDRVRLAPEPCPCGRPFAVIDSIEGRQEQVLSFPALDGGQREVNPIVFYRVLDLIPCTGWQVVQEPDHLRVLLSGVAEDVSDVALIGALTQELAQQDISVPAIVVQRVHAFPRGATGKHMLVTKNTAK